MSGPMKFIVGKMSPADTWAREGKPEWKSHLRIAIGHARALELAESLIRQARLEPDGDIYFSLHGELSDDPDE